jgi:hypothetical protein
MSGTGVVHGGFLIDTRANDRAMPAILIGVTSVVN